MGRKLDLRKKWKGGRESTMEKNKTVLITGGAKGIGAAISKKFAEKGYCVLINYWKSQDGAIALEKQLLEAGAKVAIFKADVSKRAQVEQMMAFCLKTFGSLDVLVNNAGLAYTSLFDTISEEEWNEIMDVNLKGTFNCCQAVLPSLLRQKSGSIINISSIWGMVGGACEVHYSAAKAGVIGLTKALAKELGPSNIGVNCVAPGIIKTDMISNLNQEEFDDLIANTPMQKMGSPDDVANTVYFLASEAAGFFTGQIISPNGGFVI